MNWNKSKLSSCILKKSTEAWKINLSTATKYLHCVTSHLWRSPCNDFANAGMCTGWLANAFHLQWRSVWRSGWSSTGLRGEAAAAKWAPGFEWRRWGRGPEPASTEPPLLLSCPRSSGCPPPHTEIWVKDTKMKNWEKILHPVFFF